MVNEPDTLNVYSSRSSQTKQFGSEDLRKNPLRKSANEGFTYD